MLPILHLNGYKIANPTVRARIPREELEQLFRGYGWTPYFVQGHDPATTPYSGYVHYIAAGAIALTATFNYVGLKWGSLVQNLTTAARYGGLLFIIMLAFALGLPKTGGYYTPGVPGGSSKAGARSGPITSAAPSRFGSRVGRPRLLPRLRLAA